MKSCFAVSLFLLLCGLAVPVQAQVLVANTSTWKYLHPTDGKDPAAATPDFHKTFMTAAFDDSKWKSGTDAAGANGGFAYGEEDFKGVDLERPEDEEHRKSAYFRVKFKSTEAHSGLLLKCQYDDGIIVYIDGKEVARRNIESGKADAYDLYAIETVGGDAESEVQSISLKIDLPAGDHVLAISLHNTEPPSSDLRLAEVSLEVAKPAK